MFFSKLKIPVEVSARHAHLDQQTFEALFGAGCRLSELKKLSQPSDFAAQETISIKAGQKEIKNVRLVGPARTKNQIEISMTDAMALGVEAPLKLSGDLPGSAPITLIGPKGQVDLPEGLIVARRHIHCSPIEAKKNGLRHGQIVAVEIGGPRAVTFHCVEVRVSENYKLCMHVDADEGNSAGITKSAEGTLASIKFKK